MRPSSKKKNSSKKAKKSSPLPRPFITLKLATSLDGKIALNNGQSEWITCEASRLEGRKLRASHDAIAVGSNTAVFDNPQLTARLPEAQDPVRIVFDSRLRILPESNLVLTAKTTPVWVFTKIIKTNAAQILRDKGVRLFEISGEQGLDIPAALDVMGRNGIDSLLVEGGGQLAASFVKTGNIDRIEWFRAPIIIGGDGRSGIAELGLENLDVAYHFRRADVTESGVDIRETYERIS